MNIFSSNIASLSLLGIVRVVSTANLKNGSVDPSKNIPAGSHRKLVPAILNCAKISQSLSNNQGRWSLKIAASSIQLCLSTSSPMKALMFQVWEFDGSFEQATWLYFSFHFSFLSLLCYFFLFSKMQQSLLIQVQQLNPPMIYLYH